MICTLLLVLPLTLDGPVDNSSTQVRRIPKAGISVPDDVRASLERRLELLKQSIDAIDSGSAASSLLPDVQIFHKAVHDALTYDEFFDTKEIAKAEELLAEGEVRAKALASGTAPWSLQTGLVVRGYVSKIDGSVQPYGLVVPDTWQSNSGRLMRLDVWFHGRGETLSEVNFLDDHRKRSGEFTPRDAFVLHPYGRYCNAFKFAGEIDVLEAIESVRKHYPIDEERIAARGFSMGGAAAWQFATHYTDQFFAANPGAGFAETRRFLETFQNEQLSPSDFERDLWHLYDCPDWAANLSQLPVVAYSGELDRQKQAADVMAEALRPLGIELTHIIGPKTEHKYHPDSAAEVERRMNLLARRGREGDPNHLHFVTYTLRYNRMHWLIVDGLEEHWRRAEVRAQVDGSVVRVDADNVTDLTIDFRPGSALLPPTGAISVTFGAETIEGELVRSDRSWRMSFHHDRLGHWKAESDATSAIRKKHGLQGPIDDAFMDSFVFVIPTGQGAHPRVNGWVETESKRAIEHWRRQFRGEARVKNDVDISSEDVANSNLVLWGDPSSNVYLKQILGQLPISWDSTSISVGSHSFPAEDHVPVLICPNPRNPSRYVVANSGFTYREYDYLNNARQVPKLPDWAIIDVTSQPDARHPGKIEAAGFFGEDWKLK
jgi:pimeloyl-ACP methyl ester carboxylesterase